MKGYPTLIKFEEKEYLEIRPKREITDLVIKAERTMSELMSELKEKTKEKDESFELKGIPIIKAVAVNERGEVEEVDEFNLKQVSSIEVSFIQFVKNSPKTSSPIYPELASLLKNNYQALRMDCEENIAICKSFEIDSFPKFGIIDDEFFYPYTGPIETNHLLQFLTQSAYKKEKAIALPNPPSSFKNFSKSLSLFFSNLLSSLDSSTSLITIVIFLIFSLFSIVIYFLLFPNYNLPIKKD